MSSDQLQETPQPVSIVDIPGVMGEVCLTLPVPQPAPQIYCSVLDPKSHYIDTHEWLHGETHIKKYIAGVVCVYVCVCVCVCVSVCACVLCACVCSTY